jgi:hypothetical protein
MLLPYVVSQVRTLIRGIIHVNNITLTSKYWIHVNKAHVVASMDFIPVIIPVVH